MDDARDEIVPVLPQLRGFARSLCGGDQSQADDLVQDTVVLALRAWDSFAPGTSLKSWLLKILHNRFHSLKRRKYLTAEIGRDDLDQLSTVPPSQHSRLEVASFKQAFARLKPEHRTVLVLSAVHGQPYEAIAEICGCQVGTVKSRISRARSQLKELMLGDEGPAASLRPSPRLEPAAPRRQRRVVLPLRPALPSPARPPVSPLTLLLETESEIVRVELRVTRCSLIAGCFARTGVNAASAELLTQQVSDQLAMLHARREQLLRAGREPVLAA